jgi:hypothetical protein
VAAGRVVGRKNSSPRKSGLRSLQRGCRRAAMVW